MRNPRDYWKSALVGQILATTLYIVIGSVVYEFAGTCKYKICHVAVAIVADL